MKLLLDTHTFIWWDSDPSKLSQQVLALLQYRTNILLLSVTSIWEMQIKIQLGKLRLNLPLAEIVESQQQSNNIAILTITHIHVLALESLPTLHKDPFDCSRYLIVELSTFRGLLYRWRLIPHPPNQSLKQQALTPHQSGYGN